MAQTGHVTKCRRFDGDSGDDAASGWRARAGRRAPTAGSARGTSAWTVCAAPRKSRRRLVLARGGGRGRRRCGCCCRSRRVAVSLSSSSSLWSPHVVSPAVAAVTVSVAARTDPTQQPAGYAQVRECGSVGRCRAAARPARTVDPCWQLLLIVVIIIIVIINIIISRSSSSSIMIMIIIISAAARQKKA